MTQFELGKLYLRQQTLNNGHSVTCLYDDEIGEARYLCKNCKSAFSMKTTAGNVSLIGTPKSCHEKGKK